MRDNLTTFQPTEDEFRKIFEVRKAFEDQYAFNRGGGDETARQWRQQAQQQMEDQLKATLGEQRYRDYQLSQDERYRDLSEFAQRSNLPRETVDTVYEMRRAAEDALKKVRSDSTLAPEVKQAALAALAEETRRSVSQTLGEQAWKDYQRRDGRWIEQLAPSPSGRNPGGRNGDSGGRGNRGGAARQ
jgi:CRP-like cAMP-binding protein